MQDFRELLKTEQRKLTRLETLCKVHGHQGGIIHTFNYTYGTDFVAMSDDDFNAFLDRFFPNRDKSADNSAS